MPSPIKTTFDRDAQLHGMTIFKFSKPS